MKNRLYLYVVLCFSAYSAQALELLDLPAAKNKHAHSSVMLAMNSSESALTLVGERGHIIDMQGQQWQQANVPTSVTITDITTLNDGSQVAVGHDGIIISRSSVNAQWQKQFDGYELTKQVIKAQQDTIAQLKKQLPSIEDEIAKEDLTYRIEDLEFALEDSQLELQNGPNKPLLAIAKLSDDTLFVVGAYGTLLQSTDAGNSWTLQSKQLENPSNFHLNSIISDAQDNLYIVGENATAFRSLDKGATFEAMQLPYHGSFFGIVAHSDNSTLLAFGLQGNMAISSNGGESWQSLATKAPTSLLGGTVDGDKAYLVGQGGVITTVDFAHDNAVATFKHPSGNTFADILIQQDTLYLSGQHGLTTWSLNHVQGDQ